jgi:hypothetical protein
MPARETGLETQRTREQGPVTISVISRLVIPGPGSGTRNPESPGVKVLLRRPVSIDASGGSSGSGPSALRNDDVFPRMFSTLAQA